MCFRSSIAVKPFFLSTCLLFLAMVSLACVRDVSQAMQTRRESHTPVTDAASLIRQLRAAGMNVETVGEVDQPFLSVRGTMIKLQGEDVQIFQYSSAKEMEAQAALISSDGTAVGTRKIHWIGSPHFFKQGRVLVLYVGDDKKIEKAPVCRAIVDVRQHLGKSSPPRFGPLSRRPSRNDNIARFGLARIAQRRLYGFRSCPGAASPAHWFTSTDFADSWC
jgi:hypothetical protein